VTQTAVARSRRAGLAVAVGVARAALIWATGGAAGLAVVVAESVARHTGLAVLFARPRLQRAYRRFGRWIDRVAGGVFVAVGARFLLVRS